MGCVHPPLVVEPWLLLASHWEGFTKANQLQGLAVTTDHRPLTTVEDRFCRSPTQTAGLNSTDLWCPLRQPFECVTFAVDSVVLQCGLKLFTRCAGSGAFWEVQVKISCHLCSASYHPPWATKNLQKAATWAGVGGAQERPSFEPGWLLLVPGLGPLSKRYGDC